MIEARVVCEQLHVGQVSELTLELANTDSGPCANLVFKLALPTQIVLLGGGVRVEAARLDAGAVLTRVLRVRPDEVGTWTLRSSNFSYRDRQDRSHRITDFAVPLTVRPVRAFAPAPPPRFAVTLLDHPLVHDEWDVLRGRVTNTGVPVLVGLVVGISGQLEVDRQGATQSLGTLPPGETAEFAFHVRPRAVGRQVPVHLTVDCRTDAGQLRTERCTMTVEVTRQRPRTPGLVKILYLASNPTTTMRLRLDAELREIRQAIRLGKGRDGFEVHDAGAVRIRDITQTLLDHQPQIVHFSGHGTDGQLLVEDDLGHPVLIPVDGLAALFRAVSDTVKCVIVNACDSELLAKAIVEHVDHVIGMREGIGDPAAIAFSIGFYQALAADRSVDKAFELACAQIGLHREVAAQFQVPLLLRRPQVGR